MQEARANSDMAIPHDTMVEFEASLVEPIPGLTREDDERLDEAEAASWMAMMARGMGGAG